jgi:hypothetical protein
MSEAYEPRPSRMAALLERLWLGLEDGRDYEVPPDPVKVLGLINHLAGKSWATTDLVCDAIERIAGEGGWDIHGYP